jgi:hypothetical protein
VFFSDIQEGEKFGHFKKDMAAFCMLETYSGLSSPWMSLNQPGLLPDTNTTRPKLCLNRDSENQKLRRSAFCDRRPFRGKVSVRIQAVKTFLLAAWLHRPTFTTSVWCKLWRESASETHSHN